MVVSVDDKLQLPPEVTHVYPAQNQGRSPLTKQLRRNRLLLRFMRKNSFALSTAVLTVFLSCFPVHFLSLEKAELKF